MESPSSTIFRRNCSIGSVLDRPLLYWPKQLQPAPLQYRTKYCTPRIYHLLGNVLPAKGILFTTTTSRGSLRSNLNHCSKLLSSRFVVPYLSALFLILPSNLHWALTAPFLVRRWLVIVDALMLYLPPTRHHLLLYWWLASSLRLSRYSHAPSGSLKPVSTFTLHRSSALATGRVRDIFRIMSV